MPARRAPGHCALHRLAAVAALVLAGCAGQQPASLSESQLGHERTFKVALGALTDQKLAISRQDVRAGIAIGADDAGVSIVATLEELPSGTIRVTFRDQPAGANPVLLKRVTDAYNARMAQHGVLGAFKGPEGGGGGGGGGPVPCPGGPALCK